jgi:ADP-heptose:LPS heptosyltransferase
VLVLRPGALGDTLLAVPALRALRARFGALTLAAHGGAARLLASVGEVDEGLAFDDPRLAWVFQSAESAPTESVAAWLNPAQAPGLATALLVAPSRPSGEQHCAEYLLQTLVPLGCSQVLDQRPLAIAPIVTDEVLIHPGSGSAAKNWPAARFAELITTVDAPVRLIVGEADVAAAEAVERSLGRTLPRLEQPPLAELAQRLAGCRGYVGNDSGVSHLAGLCGAHTVALFGPTNPAVWRPLGPSVTVFSFDASTEQLMHALLGSSEHASD